MEQKNNVRFLYLLQYLYENTDEEHPATTADIIKFFAERDIKVHRQTIASDIELLNDFGFDIITVRSRQNMYFYGTRLLDLAELKMIVDAIQAAKFITSKKSEILIKKLMALASKKQSHRLNRHLHFAERPKATNESILYTVDLLYDAINESKRVKFKYIEYTPEKKKSLKHKGFENEFCPYDLVWHNDSYYVFGYSEKHGKVIKFRVDRIYKPQKLVAEARALPTDYDLPLYIKRTFSMFDDEIHIVHIDDKEKIAAYELKKANLKQYCGIL